MRLVTVRAPASTSNIGPGFDCLGAAVGVSLEVRVERGGAPDDGTDLVRRAVVAAGGPPDVAVGVRSDIPVARGLGSSAACVAAGLVAGCVLAGKTPDPAELLRLGTPLEGHPDNLAAALYGGLTLAFPDGGVLGFEPSPAVVPLVLVPGEKLKTSDARAVLSERVHRRDAVANIARTAGLLALLAGAATPTPDLLLACTGDSVHQDERAPLMPRTAEAVRRLRDEGIAAAVSGAGPSVVCLVLTGGEDAVRDASRSLEGWELLEPGWDARGARVLEGGE